MRTADEAWTLVGRLAGEWKNGLDTGSMRSYEQWALRDSSTYDGLGFVLSGTDTVSIEDLRITRTASAITYSARISTQNDGQWVDFVLEPAAADTLRFTNPDHDFPKEIRYALVAPNIWDVLARGGDRSFTLRFERRPSE